MDAAREGKGGVTRMMEGITGGEGKWL
jgi:hypothetical protein